MRRARLALLSTVMLMAALVCQTGLAVAEVSVTSKTLISTTQSGQAGNQGSAWPTMTPDGRYVVFYSKATDLVPSANMDNFEILLKDRQTNTTEVISQSTTGYLTHGLVDSVAGISDSGRYVAFAANVSGPSFSPAPSSHVFIRDRLLRTTTQADISSEGAYIDAHCLSASGRVIVYVDIIGRGSVKDLDTGVVTLLPEQSNYVTISADGNYVSYTLPSGISYRYGISNGEITEIGSTNKLMLSADGSHAVYIAGSDLIYRNIQTGQSKTISTNVSGSYNVSLSLSSDDRMFSYFVRNSSGVGQVWVADLATGQNLLVDSGATKQPSMQLSADGTELVFTSNIPTGDNINQVYIAHLDRPTDTTSPLISGVVDHQANSAGWYNGDVTINWSATDPAPSSGAPTTPAPTVASQEGTQTYVSGPSCDPAGNCAIGSLALSIDKTAPTVTSASFSTNPKPVSQSSVTLTAQVGDSVSGVTRAEYYDPVRQAWFPMTLSGSTATVTISTSAANYPPNTYQFKVRVWDRADNQSTETTVTLRVYDTSSTIFGAGTITPSGTTSNPGDILPTVTGRNIRANFNFFATYVGNTLTGSSAFTYGSNCTFIFNRCFTVTANALNWLMVPNGGHTAVLQGRATVILAGQNLGSNFIVRYTITDGINGGPDHYLMQVYQSTANPDVDQPVYQASGNLTSGTELVLS